MIVLSVATLLVNLATSTKLGAARRVTVGNNDVITNNCTAPGLLQVFDGQQWGYVGAGECCEFHQPHLLVPARGC